ncbi:MerR family transcriptional regulator [Holdemania filiformis]|uniref:Transcriptional regulator, MerR family n=1 Tax=Holdemania filiformis DSM 12042 TaxID=545696 RepID=B9Y6A6_9FIRM|nr:MerR family transcriptional regulator [Holdemania filiformis]EEF68441.1 transcriptional regulator, MerR family [Holdemania filiformis DSM 12042]
MRVQEVCKKTGLSRKAVHFYIQEGLVRPAKNQNGYYDLSEADVKTLEIIQRLRQLDLPIEVIHEAFRYPISLNFFLHRHVYQRKQKINEMAAQLEVIRYILERIPCNATPDLLLKLPRQHFDPLPPNHLADSLGVVSDARMIAILLLAPFLDIEVDPYRQFLWDRISSELRLQFKENLTVLQQLIYHLSAQQIQRSTEAQYALFLRLSQGDSLEPFEAELLNQCRLLNEDEQLQVVWVLLYELILRPTLEFYQSALLGLMMEFSDRFTLCMRRLEAILKNIQEDPAPLPLIERLKTTLHGKFELGQGLNSDLFLVYTFSCSLFSSCTVEQLQEWLKPSSY